MTTATHKPAVPRDEELRLALVMNGGVSLTVWIGGVAHEINRFVGETHPVYRQLLELTSTRARVDVISGTSAGGVNGAALALTCVYDTTLYSLRDLWLSKGAFTDLLRQPGEQDAPSLLDGDGYFLPSVQQAFRDLTRDRPRSREHAPMDLSLTATMLRGEPHARLDDLGERIEDSHHRAIFHIAREANRDPFEKPRDLETSLAQAARASASFPVAFEPRLFAAEQFVNANTQEAASFDRYLIDGGVLDNKPLRGALRAIFKMPATGNVRRVLAYVVPDPAVTAVAAADKADEPPSIAEVTMSSLMGIPAAQSIADQLQQVDEHNTDVRRRRHTFAWLAANLTAKDLQAMAQSLFTAYRKRRIDGLLDYVLEEVEAELTEIKGMDDVAFGRRTRDWLKALWQEAPGAEQAWAELIPDTSDAWNLNLEIAPASSWTWGLYTIESLVGLILDLLRRTQRLAHLMGQTGEVANAPAIPGDQAKRIASPGIDNEGEETIDWDLQDMLIRNQRLGSAQQDYAMEQGDLAELWQGTYQILETIQDSRRRGTEGINAAADKLLEILRAADAAQTQQAEQTAPISARLVDWLKQSVSPPDGVQGLKLRYAELARRLAVVLLDLGKPMQRLSEIGEDTIRPKEKLALGELKQLHALLFEDQPDANALTRRLLQLEVVHYSMAGRSQAIDTIVELVQISGRGQSPWGGPDTPATKLTGMQLAHFGAFYRKSWRANDWMMGRLDGIDRIVRVALNPDRLHRLYAGRTLLTAQGKLTAADYVGRFVQALAVDTAAPSHRTLLQAHWQADEVKRELAFLDKPAARAPETLRFCAAALTRRLHLEVLCKELPVVARSAQDDAAAGAVLGHYGALLVQRVQWDRGPWRRFADRSEVARESIKSLFHRALRRSPKATPPSSFMGPEAAVAAFSNCPVGSEVLAQELGSDLMTRTAGQAITVMHAAAVGKHLGIATLSGALKALTLPVRLFYLLANRLALDSRTSAAVATALLVGGFLFVLGASSMDKPPAGLALAGWSMLIGWFGTALARQMRMTVTFALISLAVLFAYATPNGEAQTTAAGSILIALVVLMWAPTWILAISSALAALWWSTGRPSIEEIGAAACSGPLAWSGCQFSGMAEHAKDFIGVLKPMTIVFVLSLFAYLATRRRH